MATEATKNYIPAKTFLCVREDGMLVMGNENSIQLSQAGMRLRPYPGKVTDSHDVIQRFLRGGDSVRDLGAMSPTILENQLANVEAMDKGDLIEYGMDEYGIEFAPKTSAVEMRKQILAFRETLNNPAPANGIGGIAASA